MDAMGSVKLINNTIKKILLLGSGGLKISQAGEFDYSGSQAIKALKEEGLEVVLVNPNIATIQTDVDFEGKKQKTKNNSINNLADEVYLQPLTLEAVSQIIEKERPEGLLLGFGGQTALNLGLALEASGILKKYNIQVLGTSTETIRKAEDRKLFKDALDEIKIKTAKSFAVETLEEAILAAQKVGYPLMLRAGFSLGGLGSGIIYDEKSLKIKAQKRSVPPHKFLLKKI